MAATKSIIKAIGRALVETLSPSRTRPDSRFSKRKPSRPKPTGAHGKPATSGSDYPGDFEGPTTLTYDPHPGKTADPGEVVWTWVPYEEDHSQGKDRPVLVIGREQPWLLALPMTSQDHDRDAAHEASQGRYWCDLGRGDWDAEGRMSEVRVNRIVRIDPSRVRRISSRVSPEVFERVAAAVRSHWQPETSTT